MTGLIGRALDRAPVVVLTGARQTGKTTLVTSLIGQRRDFITLDDIEILERAEKQPDSLLVWRETVTPSPEILYWRTDGGKEVDFVIESAGGLTPLEVKASIKPKLADIAGLNAFLDEYPKNAKHGILIHTGSRTERLTSRIWAIPLRSILGC